MFMDNKIRNSIPNLTNKLSPYKKINYFITSQLQNTITNHDTTKHHHQPLQRNKNNHKSSLELSTKPPNITTPVTSCTSNINNL